MPRSRSPIRLALTGAALGLGAPAGWLALRYLSRSSQGHGVNGWLLQEIADSSMLYAYLAVSTVTVFAVYGWRLGSMVQKLKRQTHEKMKLHRLSITDSLTGLYNRGFFDRCVEDELARARRLYYPLSLLLLDMDDLKAINDRYGHPVGDEVLAKIGFAIDQALRETDLAFRYGGDEFVVLLPNCDEGDLAEVEQRLLALIDEHAQPAVPLPRRVSVSVGRTTFHPGKDSSGTEMVRQADRELYGQKKTKKPAVRLASHTARTSAADSMGGAP
ncbi:MAG: GGDEF domain-containing protein [Nitrospirae bacterium]|nr:GGDEF domain-containing protein [Nitrospirota bacterium]